MSRSSSATVDSKVLEMSLENSNFERNAATSLSTLQKLKQALKFDNTQDGLDKVSNNIKKINLNPLSSAATKLKSDFDNLANTVGFAAIMRYTNQALDGIERLAKALTIDQVSAGWQKYSDKTTSVATLVAQGYELEKVNEQLERLNWFTDETSYNFTDMVANIAKFTATGQDLETSVTAMEGIANWAALSGQNATSASHAMYQLSQAMGAGLMRKEDYKSIQNLSMDTEEFRTKVLETAVALGTLKQTGENTFTSLVADSKKGKEEFTKEQFAESLTQGQWFTKDVMMKVFNEYSAAVDQIYEYAEEKGITASEAMAEAGAQFDAFGMKAFKAAQEARTWADVIDSVKDAVSTSFMNMFEIIFGDYEQATALWTSMANGLYDVVVEPINSFNEVLGEAFGEADTIVNLDEWNKLGLSKVQASGLAKALKEVAEANGVAFKEGDMDSFLSSLDDGWLKASTLKEILDGFGETSSTGIDGTTKSLEEFHEAALKVIRGGETGYSSNMAERFKQLTEDGFDPERVQAYVNELHKLAGGTWNLTDAIMEQADANLQLEESIASKSDEELLAMGYTRGEIKQLRELQKTAEETGKPLSELFNPKDNRSGRQKLLDGLKTGLEGVGYISKQVSKAFSQVFPPITSQTIGSIIDKVEKLTTKFRDFAKNNQRNIRNSFAGVFSIVDLALRVIKNFGKTVFDVFSKAFSHVPLLKFLGTVGLAIRRFRDWVVENKLIEKAFQGIEGAILKVAGAIGKWFDKFKQIPQVKAVIDSFKDTFKFIGDNFIPILDKAGDNLTKFKNGVVKAFTESKSPTEFVKNIRTAFEGLWKDISSSETFIRIKDSFIQLGTSVKSYINELGTNADGTRNTFGNLVDAAVRFKDNIKRTFSGVDENGEKIGFVTGIKNAFTNLWDDVTESGLIENIKTGLQTAWNTVDEFFTAVGTNADGSKNAFGVVWDGISDGLVWIHDKAIEAKDAIHNFFEEHKIGQFFANTFDTLKTGFGDFFLSLPDLFTNAKTKVEEFFAKVKEIGGFKFENLGEIWGAFKDSVKSYFDENDVFGPIAKAFGKIKDDLKEKLKENGINFDLLGDKIKGFKDKAVNIFDGFKNAVSSKLESMGVDVGSLSESFGRIGEAIREAFDSIKENGLFKSIANLFSGETTEAAQTKGEEVTTTIKGVGDKIRDAFKSIRDAFKDSPLGEIAKGIFDFFGRIGNAILNVDPDTLWNIAKAFVAFKLIKGAWNEIKGIVQQVVDGLTNLWDSMALKNKAQANFINKAALIEMAVAIGIVGYVIYQLAHIEDMGKAWEALGMLGAVLAGLSAAMLILNRFGGGQRATMTGTAMLEMAAAIGIVGYVISQLAQIKDLNKAWEVLGILGTVLGALTGVLTIGSLIGAPAEGFGIGMLALSGALLLATLALKALSSVDFEGLVNNLVDAVKAWDKGIEEIDGSTFDEEKSSTLLWTLKGITFVVGSAAISGFITGVGDFVTSMLGQGTTMDNFGEGVTAIIGAVNDWHAAMSQITWDTAGESFGKSFLVLSEMVGIEAVVNGATVAGFIKGVGDFVLNFLGQKSTMEQFSEAVDALVGVINDWHFAMGQITWEDAGDYFGKSALILTEMAGIQFVIAGGMVEGFIAGIDQFVREMTGHGGSLMGDFSEQVNKLIDIITDWHTAMDKLTWGSVGSTFGKTALLSLELFGIEGAIASINITELVSTVEDFIAGFLGVESLIGEFQKDVSMMVEILDIWQTNTKDLKPGENFSTESIDMLIASVEHMNKSQFWNAIEEFITKKDFSEEFKKTSTDLGKAISAFTDGFKDVDSTTIDNGSKIVDSLSTLGANLIYFVSNTGADYNTGSNIEQFGQQIRTFGTDLAAFVESCPDPGQFSSIATSFDTLVDATKEISEVNLSDGDFFDNSKIQSMRTNVSILTGVVVAASAVGAFSFGVETFISTVGDIAGISLSDSEIARGAGVDAFGANITKLKNILLSLSSFNAPGVDDFVSAIDKIKGANLDFTTTGSGIGNQIALSIGAGISSGISDITEQLNSAINSALDGVDISGAEKVGTNITNQIADGVSGAQRVVKNAVSLVIKAGQTAANSLQSAFFSAGQNLSRGLAAGISAGRSAAISAAISVATEALNAAKAALDEHSPSKEAEKIGMFFDLGFARGLRRYRFRVAEESTDVANSAMSGVSRAILESNRIIDGIDRSGPRITPVVDLSQVRRGAASIGSIFSKAPNTIAANFNAIGVNADTMRERNRDTDILNALDLLNNNLVDRYRPGDTINVNGITYDDGSNVSSAVKDLIRAIRVERRA